MDVKDPLACSLLIYFLYLFFCILLSSICTAQLEDLVDVASPTGLIIIDEDLYIGSYAGSLFKFNLELQDALQPLGMTDTYRMKQYKSKIYGSDSQQTIYEYDLDENTHLFHHE